MSSNNAAKNSRPIALAVIISIASLFIAVHVGHSSGNANMDTAKHAALTVSSKAGVHSASQRDILREEDWKRIAKD